MGDTIIEKIAEIEPIVATPTTNRENYFNKLYFEADVSGKVKKKNNLNYLSWAAAWAEVKKNYPDSTYHVYENAEGRFWFDDKKSGWVKVCVTINNINHTEHLAIMNHRNQAIPAEDISSTDAVNSMQRALTKACGRHGVGLYLYEGEEMSPGAKKDNEELKKEIKKVITESRKVIDSGVDKEEVYRIISDHNDDNKNPQSIKNTEICRDIIVILKDMKKEKK
ncbi:MAG: DUF1071 domain-containing protein [Eubacterium sp.]